MKFYKYHGCGNDFVLAWEEKCTDYSRIAKKICDRRLGVGADGLIVCSDKPPSMRIFNRDGSEASMCGNGIRCVAKLLIEKGVADVGESFHIMTLDGQKTVRVGDNGDVEVDMGAPRFDPGGVMREVEIGGRKTIFYTVFVGCAHAVVLCDDIFREILFGTGEKISTSELFSQRINVDITRVESRSSVTVRTFERGVGFTAACGTGACAVYAVLRKLRLCDEELEVKYELGTLLVSGKDKIRLCGEAVRVFCGEWEEM